LGPLDEESIDQRGERWQDVAQPFKILDVPHLKRLLAPRGSFLSDCKPASTAGQTLAELAPHNRRQTVL
jgi:hypothetical protein